MEGPLYKELYDTLIQNIRLMIYILMLSLCNLKRELLHFSRLLLEKIFSNSFFIGLALVIEDDNLQISQSIQDRNSKLISDSSDI